MEIKGSFSDNSPLCLETRRLSTVCVNQGRVYSEQDKQFSPSPLLSLFYRRSISLSFCLFSLSAPRFGELIDRVMQTLLLRMTEVARPQRGTIRTSASPTQTVCWSYEYAKHYFNTILSAFVRYRVCVRLRNVGNMHINTTLKKKRKMRRLCAQ